MNAKPTLRLVERWTSRERKKGREDEKTRRREDGRCGKWQKQRMTQTASVVVDNVFVLCADCENVRPEEWWMTIEDERLNDNKKKSARTEKVGQTWVVANRSFFKIYSKVRRTSWVWKKRESNEKGRNDNSNVFDSILNRSAFKDEIDGFEMKGKEPNQIQFDIWKNVILSRFLSKTIRLDWSESKEDDVFRTFDKAKPGNSPKLLCFNWLTVFWTQFFESVNRICLLNTLFGCSENNWFTCFYFMNMKVCNVKVLVINCRLFQKQKSKITI